MAITFLGATIGWLGINVVWLGEAAVVKGGWEAVRLQAAAGACGSCGRARGCGEEV
jgi:hypothetical protein